MGASKLKSRNINDLTECEERTGIYTDTNKGKLSPGVMVGDGQVHRCIMCEEMKVGVPFGMARELAGKRGAD